MCGVPDGSSRDISLGAEIGALAGKSGPMKSFTDPRSPLSQRYSSPTQGFSRIMYATICLARPGIMYSVGEIAGIGGSAGGDPPY